MNILISANAFWAATGYGVPAMHLLKNFMAAGHRVGQFAWYGVQGGKIMYGDIPLYPAAYDPWGSDVIGQHAKDFGADLVISIMDTWVLPPDYRDRIGTKWAAWFPVDHDPIPRQVLERVKGADYRLPFSRFGEREMQRYGEHCTYMPIGVDTTVYCPDDKAAARERMNLPREAFICGMVAANKGQPVRKAFAENMQAFARLRQERPDLDAKLYLHTQWTTAMGGVDFDALIADLGIGPHVYRVDQYQNLIGLPPAYLADAYRSMDVLLAASTCEGFGIPIVEAQACGTPVISTNWTSMPELTVNGIVTEPCQRMWDAIVFNSWAAVPSVDNITDALLRIASWDVAERTDRAKWGIQHVQDHYDWQVIMERHWLPFLAMVEGDATA